MSTCHDPRVGSGVFLRYHGSGRVGRLSKSHGSGRVTRTRPDPRGLTRSVNSLERSLLLVVLYVRCTASSCVLKHARSLSSWRLYAYWYTATCYMLSGKLRDAIGLLARSKIISNGSSCCSRLSEFHYEYTLGCVFSTWRCDLPLSFYIACVR